MTPDYAKMARKLRALYPRAARRVAVAPPPPAADPAAERPLESYRDDPVGFISEVLGVTLTPDQAAIARKLPGRVKVNSGHNIGKTALAACLSIWWFYTRPKSVVITTAPTERDVIDMLWTEIRIRVAGTRRPLPNYFAGPKSAEMFDNEEHWAKGYTARDAVSFQGRHRESMLFVFDECHDDKTEVLTEHGWRYFAALDGTERLLTMDQETGVSEYCLPLRIVKRAHAGEVYRYACAGADFCVTPGHRMLWQTAHSNSGGRVYGAWRRTRMDELAERKSPAWMTRRVVWDAPDVADFVLPAIETDRKSFADRVLPMDDWLAFLGWYFSEGHLIKAANGKVYGVAITQKDNLVRTEIAVLCRRLGFGVSESSGAHTPQIYFSDMQVSRWLSQYGANSLTKRCPDFIRHLGRRQISVFLETYIEGDGSRYPLRDVIYTSSQQMASDLNELVLKTGVDSTVNRRPEKLDVGTIAGREVRSAVRGYLVSRARRAKRMKYVPKHLRREFYSGMVYCAELPRHNLLLTRRNGKVLWSGNCEGIPAVFWDVTGTSYKDGCDHGWLAIGNPVTTSSQSYVEDRARRPDGTPKWDLTSLSALNHPNIHAELAGLPPPIPNAVGLSQVDQWVQDWCEPIDPAERLPDDLEWRPGSGNWYRPGPQMKARGLGIRPVEGTNTVWGARAWREACYRRWTPEQCWAAGHGITIGVDVASYGDDFTVLHVRTGPLSLHHESHNGWGPQRIADRIQELSVHWAAWYNARQTADGYGRPPLRASEVRVTIELDGPGAAVLDLCNGRGAWGGVKVAEASEKYDALGIPMYSNIRSEMWFAGRDKALAGWMDLSRLPEAVRTRLEDQLLTPAYKLLPAGTQQVEAKDAIKLRLKRSPDDADGLLVCYLDVPTYSPTVLFKNGG